MECGFLFEFATQPLAGGGEIRITGEPGRPGVLTHMVQLEGGPSLSFRQWILP